MNSTQKKDEFIDIPVHLEGAIQSGEKRNYVLQDLVLQSFQDEVFEGDNKYYCEVWNASGKDYQKIVNRSPPLIYNHHNQQVLS